MTEATLPGWAALAAHQVDGRLLIVDVDADAMYRAWLAAFAANPPRPADFPGRRMKAGPAIPAMSAKDAACDPAAPTQYWLECAYQCMKLELQVALRRFDFEIRVHDAEKAFALAKWPAGRGGLAATRGLEAKAHFKRLRGVLPA